MKRKAAFQPRQTPALLKSTQAQPAKPSTAEHPLSELQRAVGNRAMRRLLGSPYIQTKLRVSRPGDPYEQEADRVADTVMRVTEPETAPGGREDEEKVAPKLEHGATLQEGGLSRTKPLDNRLMAFRQPRVQRKEEPRPAPQAAGSQAHVNPASSIRIARKGDDPENRSYWFQQKPPEKPITTGSGIEITPKGQVFLDPNVQEITSTLGKFKLQFAGLDNDFRNGKPTPAFASAEKAVIAAIRGAVGELWALPDIKNAPSQKAAEAQRRQDEITRARLMEAARTLSGKTLNIFIATDLTIAEKLSSGSLSLRTEQVFVRAADIGDPSKLEAAVRVPLIALTGGVRGVAPGPGGTLQETSVQALTDEQAKEAILHEMMHVMLINKGLSAVQVWQAARPGVVSGPDDVKGLAEDVLFRYVRAQEEVFVYSAIAGMYSAFKSNKDLYELFVNAVEIFVKSVGGKLEPRKPVPIDVKEKIGEGKKKESVTWSISYTLPKGVKVDKAHLTTLKELQKADVGS